MTTGTSGEAFHQWSGSKRLAKLLGQKSIGPLRKCKDRQTRVQKLKCNMVRGGKALSVLEIWTLEGCEWMQGS